MSDNLQETSNYQRFITMVIDLGTEVMLLLFFHLIPVGDGVTDFLSKPYVKRKLDYMQKRKLLSPHQYEIVASSNPDPYKFDLTSLITLLSNLFKDKIEKPTNGWETFPPYSDDFSVGADLLRLKRIRNEIVGHHVKAQMPNSFYKDLWQQTESLLLRIVTVVDSKKVLDMKRKFFEYETRLLDTPGAAQKAIDTVKMWYDEIRILQEQVENMTRKSKELYDTLQYVEQYQRKYFSLLVEGGRIVLLGIWKRETQKYQDSEIWDMIEQRKISIETKLQIDLEGLYSNGRIQVNSMDISDLGTLIKSLFHEKLDTSEVSDIDELLDMKNQYAKVVFTSTQEFNRKWTALVMNLTSLTAKQPMEVRSSIKNKVVFIDENENLDEAGKCLKEVVGNVRKIKTLSEEYQESLDKLEKSLRHMREEGIPFGEEKIIVFKMHIIGSTTEMTRKAEEIVDSIISKAIEMTNNSSKYEEIKNAIEKIVDHIRHIDGVTLLSSGRGCILLTFKCASFSAIIGLLGVFERDIMKEQMVDLAYSLSFYLNDEFILFATVSPTNLVTLQELTVNMRESYVPIKVSCATLSSLNEVYRYFNASDVRNIAGALSRELNDKFSIHSSVDGGSNQLLISDNESDGSNSLGSISDYNITMMKEVDSKTCEQTGCSADKEVTSQKGELTIQKDMSPIRCLTEINLGDIVSMPYYAFQHHVLITEVQVSDTKGGGTIKGIHYRLPIITSARKIVEEKFMLDFKRTSLHRVTYAGAELFSTEETISRARSRIGERKWSTSNRSENLCYWAKVKSDITNELEHLPLKKTSPSSLIMKAKEIHLANELLKGDVIQYKSDGILVSVDILDGEIGRMFRIEKVACDEYDYIVRKKEYTIDLRTDIVRVKRYSSPNCVSLTERVTRALDYVNKKGKWWSRNGFIKYCIR